MPRFNSTAHSGEKDHGNIPHMSPPIGIPPFHAPHHPLKAPHTVHHPLPPPHARAKMPLLEFDERDMKVFKEVFQDEDTVAAAMEIVDNAPLEIQLEVFQTLMMIERMFSVAKRETICLPKDEIVPAAAAEDPFARKDFARWESPVLDDNAKALYTRTYGESGRIAIGILRGAPYEIGVVSILLAFLETLVESLERQNFREES